MAFKFDLQLKSELPALPARAATRLSLALAKLALEVEGEAKQRAPVDTGALKGSIQANPTDDLLTKEVNVGVDYAGYVECGTYKMAAQPFLTPAVEVVRDKFNQVIGQAIEEAAQ